MFIKNTANYLQCLQTIQNMFLLDFKGNPVTFEDKKERNSSAVLIDIF